MKKIFVSEDSLRKIKKSIKANEKNVSLNSVLPEDKPLAEKDKFTIGAEGGNNDFFHINEGYYSNRLKNVDLSDVGRVEYEWYFDEDEYSEWLQDNELGDSEEVRNQYYTEEVTYGVTYYDSDTFHYMDSDQNLLYGDLEELFGEAMAKKMLSSCIEDGEGSFETYELYENESYDVNNPQELNDIAMKLFSHGEYYKGCRGFILTNGVIVYTPSEHNEICMIPGINNKFHFIELGNIRLLPNSIDIGAEPTYEQEEVLRKVISSYSGEELYLDIFDNHQEIGAKYTRPNWRYVIGEINRYYSEGIRPQGSNGIYENIESEVEASEVKLDSFRRNDILAPKIWDGKELNPRVRLKLLDIADDFWDFTTVTWVKRSGIHLTGSICNFNWSKFSDIDLHIVVDFSKIDERTDFVQEYFNAKKNEWNDEHSNLKIYGYPVELYVEDVNAETASDGLYDLEANKWIRIPHKDSFETIKLDKYEIKNKSAKLMTKIDDLNDEFNSTDDDAELRDIGKRAHKLLNKIKRMRKYGLERGGESDSLNIVYKVLRRSGHLDNLWDLSSKLYDKINSIGINESVDNIDYFGLAKELFGITNDVRECGYILPDGTMLNFSGKHSVDKGVDSSNLSGSRGVDHREIKMIGWSKDGTTKNFNFTMEEFIRLGAIRTHASSSYSVVNLFKKPTIDQAYVLKRIIRYSKGCVDVEIGDGDESLAYAEYDEANPNRVVGDIIRYFDEGINLIGNVDEERIIYDYYKAYIPLKEEVVADGSANSNPFKKRWEHERKVLKDYLVNYGEIMTSKENGKQYKVLYDTMLSQNLGINYCICIQWNQLTMEPGNVIYVRAYDKFTKRLFRPQFDARGYDNIQGTMDDVV